MGMPDRSSGFNSHTLLNRTDTGTICRRAVEKASGNLDARGRGARSPRRAHGHAHTVHTGSWAEMCAQCVHEPQKIRAGIPATSAKYLDLLEIYGEPGWDRTNDHLIKSQMLYR
jgi:hypothetical protein